MQRHEAEQTFRAYARRHPRAMQPLMRFMLGRPYRGLDADFALLAEQVPLVELQLVTVAMGYSAP